MTALPPIWKIWRETKRLGRQLLSMPFELSRKLYFRHWYDLRKTSKIKTRIGSAEFGSEVAIYLIFPESGLLKSHMTAIDEMIRSGITPVVVSNFPLVDKDLEVLLSKAALVMERPNIGYDFGGYRDAILALEDKLKSLHRLWIINDSTIMVPQKINWFEAARELRVDFAAASSNYGIPRSSLADFRSVNWTFDVTHKNFHYASYAWSLGAAILQDSDFLSFWKNLDIRNDKSRTVRRGEIGFSQWVIKRGYTHRATWEIDELKAELASLEATEIDVIANDVQILEDERLRALKTQILSQEPTTQKAVADRLSFILYAVARQASAYAIPKYGIKYKNFHFVKKSLIRKDNELDYLKSN